jgi:hypothetical protein
MNYETRDLRCTMPTIILAVIETYKRHGTDDGGISLVAI